MSTLPADQAFAADAPVVIGARLELFVDRELVDTMKQVDFRLQTPREMPLPKNPLVGQYITVIKDGDLYRAYYRDDNPAYTGRRGYSGHPGEITCYAESRDGHEWTFPALGLHQIKGSRGHENVILAGQRPFHHNFSPFLDTRAGVDPSERFKALAGHPGHNRAVKADGLHAFISADGIVWKKVENGPVIPYDKSWSHAFDSQNVSFWSEAEQLYVCYFRTYGTPDGEYRTIFRTTSPDFRTWSAPTPTFANLPGEHLYTSQTHPYFRAPHIYIALPTRYVAGRVGAAKTDPMQGSTDIMFMASRAGKTTFERLSHEAFMRPGLDPARWGNRGNYVALNVVPTGETEMSIYNTKSGHRYTLRTDGFMSVHAGAAEGELVTKPLVFDGNTLVVNYSTAAAGSLRVEVQTADGAPIPAFSLSNAVVSVGDTIQGTIAWQGNPNLAAWAGKPVRLRFVMQECDLYSYKFETRATAPR